MPAAPRKKRVLVGKKRALRKKKEPEAEAAGEIDVGAPDEEGVSDVPSGPEDDVQEAGEEESYSSDDEEGQLNRVGDVPLAWYKDEEHAGYDIEGNKILKQTQDALSQLISKFDDPSQMMTIYEKLTGKAHKLTPEDIQVLVNLQKNRYPDPHYDPYPEGLRIVQWDQNPFEKGMPRKARFQPSKHEMKIIAKLVRKLKRLEKRPPPPPKPDPTAPFLLWDDTEEADGMPDSAAILRRKKWSIGPPKNRLPTHSESYNPPLEYLKTAEELDQIKKEEPVDRPEFIPTKYGSLRKVPFYRGSLRERYQRCLDLFTFTRKLKPKLNIRPDSLLPELPKPEELRPFPQRLGFVYKGHTAPVRQVSVSPNGEWLATACDDHFARVFEVCTGRLVTKWNLKAPVSCVAWCPNPEANILAMSADKLLVFAVPASCAVDVVNQQSVEMLRAGRGGGEGVGVDAINIVSSMASAQDEETPAEDLDATIVESDAEQKQLVDWRDYEEGEMRRGLILRATHHFRIKTFCWHHKGDYVATLCPKDQKSRQVVIIQLSVRSSLSPFKRFKETVQALSFHPTQPYFLVGTRRSVRVYNLVQSQQVKKFKSSVNSVSSVDVHPGGDHVLVGSHDNAVMWYDMDMSDRPYKKLTSQKASVHSVRFHPQTSVYPLFATAGDSGQIHVFHGRVYDSLTENAFIVPLKIIKGHRVVGSVGILHLEFHPSLPWVFSAGADGTVKCWTE